MEHEFKVGEHVLVEAVVLPWEEGFGNDFATVEIEGDNQKKITIFRHRLIPMNSASEPETKPKSKVISSFDDPRIPGLLGKEVLVSNFNDGVIFLTPLCKGVLDSVTFDANRTLFKLSDDSKWKFIAEVPLAETPKPEPKQMTLSEVCNALGYEVKLVKEGSK